MVASVEYGGLGFGSGLPAVLVWVTRSPLNRMTLGVSSAPVDPSCPTPTRPDPDAPRPLAFKPLEAKPLTPADLPPSNPLLSVSFSHIGVSRSIAFGRDWRAGRDEYRPIIERESLAYGLPPALVDAVMAVESRYNSAVVGMDGEIGLMQVMLPTARMLGFTGTEAELAVPSTNIHYGVKYLAGAWRLGRTRSVHSHHEISRWTRRDALLVPIGRILHARPRSSRRERCRGHRFGAAADLWRVSGARIRSRPLSGGGMVNFAALNARLKTLTDKITPQLFPLMFGAPARANTITTMHLVLRRRLRAG